MKSLISKIKNTIICFNLNKKLNIFVYAFSFIVTNANASGICQEYLLGATSLKEPKSVSAKDQNLVRIYAGPGVVIPRQIECQYCGEGSLMPASLKDPRITIMNSTADISALQDQSGGKSPNFLGAAIRCTSCGGHSPLWELGRPGELPRPKVKTTRLEIYTDAKLGKRYVLLPKEYKELADVDSEMNRLARAQHIAICPSCSVMSLTNSKPPEGVNCTGCGGLVPEVNIYNTQELLFAADKATKNSVNRNASGPGDSTYARRNIQPAPEKLARPTNVTTRNVGAEEIRQGRSILNGFNKKWIASGVAALAITGGSVYYMNNAPMIAEGMVISVENDIAVVRFAELPYFMSDSNLEMYEVSVVLSQRQTLPGELAQDVEKGDRVTIHYTWSDFHYLPFVFHPYSGAEFIDGSILNGSGIRD